MRKTDRDTTQTPRITGDTASIKNASGANTTVVATYPNWRLS